MQFLRKGDTLLGRLGPCVKDASDLMVVWLDEEGVRGQGLQKQVAGGVDDEAHAPTLEVLHDDVVHALGKRLGYGAREHKRVPLADVVDALKQLVYFLLGDLGPHAVDHGHDDAVELDVDTGETAVKPDEVGGDTIFLHRLDEIVAREARDDAEGDVGDLELVEEGGDVDAVSTTVEFLAR